MNKYELVLYVSGRNPRTENVVENLRHMLDGAGDIEYGLSIYDVLETPERAEQDKVLATPTLIRASPLPTVRIIGDLTETERVLGFLTPVLKKN